MKNRIKRKLGFVLVIAMLIVMIYPGETGQASEESDGFTIDANGVLTAYVGSENAVVIPDTITAIGASAFQGRAITSVMIPASVTSIGDYAFASCPNLSSVTIPASVTNVGTAAFAGCSSLASVEWQSSVGIPDSAFKDCVGLTSVSIAQSMPSIGSEAFKNCSELQSVTIPASTSSIASNAFDGCTNVTAINVDEGNAYYSTSDGCLYSSTGVALLRCPQGKNSVTIQDGTQSIESNAFYGCKFGEVNVPSSVTTIKLDAFTGSEIQTLILGNYVSVFEEQTFTVYCIQVPGTAPVAPQLVEEYEEIVQTDYVPGQPDTPDTPNTPDTPDTPDTPEQPDTPNQPDTPGNSGGSGNTSDNGNQNNGNSSNDNTNTNSGNSGAANNSGGTVIASDDTDSDKNTSTVKKSSTGTQPATATTLTKNGIPNLKNEKGVSGWDAIYEEMQNAAEGDLLEINMNGATKVPKQVLSTAKTKKLELVLYMDDTLVWDVNGKDITGSDIKDTDFGVKLGTSNVPEKLQKEVAGEDWSIQMHLSAEGVFGMTATLKVMLGKPAANHTAILYYYNAEDQKLEYISQATVASGGEATFHFEHASDYVIVVEGLSASATGMTATDTHVQDDTPSTGPELNAKYILCLGVMLLGIYLILSSKKETYQTA